MSKEMTRAEMDLQVVLALVEEKHAPDQPWSSGHICIDATVDTPVERLRLAVVKRLKEVWPDVAFEVVAERIGAKAIFGANPGGPSR